MPPNFITLSLEKIPVGEPLPGNLYISIDGRFILYRAAEDMLDREAYDRLEFKKVAHLFIHEDDQAKFLEKTPPPAASSPAISDNPKFAGAREDVHRKAMDIFQAEHADPYVADAVKLSKKLVVEVMKFPFAISSLSQLQTFSRGTVDHSVNVAVLATYLAMQMGYSHTLILQHVGLGGLLHDIGKRKVSLDEGVLTDEQREAKMREHPTLGLRILENLENVPNEVKMIVAQHHEFHDGTGYPKKLRGNNIYDLARIVSIANVFDELVSQSKGTLAQKQKAALSQLDQVYFHKFEPDKLDKALRILKLGV